MAFRRLTAPLVLALAALASPVSPAAADDPSLAGGSCAAVVSGGSRTPERSGFLTGGPAWSTRPDETVVGVACSIQAGSDDPLAPDLVRAQAPGPYLPPTPVAFAMPGPVDLFVCTEIVVRRPPHPPTVYPYDADPAMPGAQCRKATRSGNDVLVVDVAPTNPLTLWCVRLDHTLPPWGYHEVCNPF